MKKIFSYTPLLLVVLSFGIVCLFPEFAFANPWQSAAQTFKSDASTILQIFAFIAVMAIGIMCACGKINKVWLIGVIIGVILIFGADQIISWIRGAAGI